MFRFGLRSERQELKLSSSESQKAGEASMAVSRQHGEQGRQCVSFKSEWSFHYGVNSLWKVHRHRRVKKVLIGVKGGFKYSQFTTEQELR
jgi:hypothetical protein